MKMLYEEISRRFPEIRPHFSEGDEELPYVVMGYLACWVNELPKEAFTPQLTDRLVSFTTWCDQQPRGRKADDNLATILMVGFYEEMFESDTTCALLPRFISREEFVAGADYLRTWIGAVNYEKAGKHYKPAVSVQK